MASLAPNKPPTALHIAIGMAIPQIMVPLIKNRTIDPKLVERFTILAWALACKKSYPSKAIKPSTKKLPVPGPINPS